MDRLIGTPRVYGDIARDLPDLVRPTSGVAGLGAEARALVAGATTGWVMALVTST